MKDATYNTGRTITIELDRLGNADIWTIYQILTGGTGDVYTGYEEDASPAADPDAATEIFLHIAETADARAEGADNLQKIWLQGIKDEYAEMFDEADEEATPEEDEEEFGGAEYLAETIAAWRNRPENAELDNLLEQNAIDTRNDPANLYRAGVFAGLVTALRTQISWASDDHNEVEAAIYRAYNVPW